MDPYGDNAPSEEEDDDEIMQMNQNTATVAVAVAEPVQYAAPAHFPAKEPRSLELEDADDDDDDEKEEENDEEEVVAAAVVASPVVVQATPVSATKVYQPIQPRGKPEALAAKVSSLKSPPPEPAIAVATPVATKKSSTKRTAGTKRKSAGNSAASPKKKVARKSTTSTRAPSPQVQNWLELPARPITEEEYENLDSLMEQFCRVPLLAEFSRPVKLLHPELNTLYAKIVTHPVDLGHVCRGIRKRKYENHRDLRLDMWRVFANCVKFHSSPANRDKVPSFVSIALHLRDYFNNLYQEYMLPSEVPSEASEELQQDISKRAQERKKRLESIGVLQMSKTFSRRVARILGQFIEDGGRTDVLDTISLFSQGTESDEEIQEVKENLRALKQDLQAIDDEGQDEITIDEFIKKLQLCFTAQGVLEMNPAARNRFRNRLDRLIGKLTVPLHEANSRGVTQSSIWGNIATTIWARESGKKPYWPALCLGILPPEDQREGWHAAVTERNEARLPQKLHAQLMGAKKKCEVAQKRVSLSYFLVEFLGTHEFIWVRETDIVEKFDPKEDPNKTANSKSKKRASRSAISSVIGSKTYATALEECEWATDEFEGVLQEAFDFEPEDEQSPAEDGEGEFSNYSYALLNQSDEEADSEDKYGYVNDEASMSLSDQDEANYLISHEGKIDPSVDAKKQSKKRAAALRKKKAEEKQKKDAALQSQRKEKKKKLDAKKKEQEIVKEQKELDRRRKKRSRDRAHQLKLEMRRKKKGRIIPAVPEMESEMRGLGFDNKRARATAVIKAFVHRMAEKEEYQNLKLGGSSVIPSATVECSGLLSMALAFRVAAGELDDSDGTTVRPTPKPWNDIDTETPKSHQERSKALEAKAKLIEEEIQRIRANTSRRKALFHTELARKAKLQEQIREDEQCARFNYFAPVKKKKKTPTKGVGKPFAPPISTDASPTPHTPSGEQGEDDGDGTGSESQPFNEYDDDGTEADDAQSYQDNVNDLDEDSESVTPYGQLDVDQSMEVE